MKQSFCALALAGLFSIGTAAQAGTVTFSADRPIGLTNWSDTLALGQFDSSLGQLTSIRFDLSGTVQGSGRAESLDSSATDVTLTLASTLSLYRPDASTLVIVNPLFSQHLSFGAFDGSIDFAGTSGGSTGLHSSSGANSFTSASASDFALFSALGGGTINLGLGAIGSSIASGAGNLISQFQTSAAGHVVVTYEYVATVVPEPASYAMLLGGLGLVGAMARRRKPATVKV